MKFCIALTVVVVALQLTTGVVAPFPEGHPYAGFNGWIDTWWPKLSPEQQKRVYIGWQRIEPTMFKLAKFVSDKKDAVKKLNIHVIEKGAYVALKYHKRNFADNFQRKFGSKMVRWMFNSKNANW